LKRATRWWVFGAVVMALCVTAWALWRQAPEWLRQQIEQRGSEALMRPVSLKALTLDLHANGSVSLALDELSVREKAVEGAPAWLAFGRLEVTLSWWRLLSEQLQLDSVHIHDPRLILRRDAQGEWNLQTWARELGQRRVQAAGSTAKVETQAVAQPAAAPASAPAGTPWSLALRDFQLHGGRVELDDRLLGQTHRLDDLDLTLPQLIWRAENGREAAEVRADWVLDGAQMAVKVQGFPSDWQRPITWQAQAAQWPLQDWWAWLPKAWPIQPSGAVLSFDLQGAVGLAPRAAQPVTALTSQGEVRIEKLALLGPERQPWFDLPLLTVQLDDVDVLKRTVKVGAVRAERPRLALNRGRDGVLDLQDWLSRWPASPPSEPWQIQTGPIQLDKVHVELRDEAVQPSTRWALSKVNVEVPKVVWPLPEASTAASYASPPMSVRVAGQLTANDADLADPAAAPSPQKAATWQLDAQLTPASVKAQVSLSNLGLIALQPYLSPFTRLRWSGMAALKGQVSLPLASPGAMALKLDAAELADVTARSATDDPNSPALAWRKLRLQGVQVDASSRRVQVEAVAWEQPAVGLRRNRQGDLNALGWFVSPSVPSQPTPTAATSKAGVARKGPAKTAAPEPAKVKANANPDWHATLGGFQLTGGALSWMDETVPSSVDSAQAWRMNLQAVDLKTGAVQWPVSPGSRAVPLRLSLRADRLDASETGDGDGARAMAATLRLNGDITPAPLAARLDVQADQWPIHRFVPYLQAAGVSLPVTLAHADAGLQGQIRWAGESPSAGLTAQGQVALSGVSLLANPMESTTSGAVELVDPELVRWNLLTVDVTQAQWQPGQKPRLDIAQIQLRDLFAKLQITEQGQLNVQMRSEPASSGAAPAPKPVPTRGAPAPSWPVDAVVHQTRLVNARIDFKDNFIRPNYRADLSQLQGRLGRFSSDLSEAAPLELTGRVAGTGELEIRGSVQPLAAPLGLNLRAKASNIELAPFTPYGGKYLGYAIDRGKLSADLSYRIGADGRLEASNQITLNQLTLGQKVDSPSATSLPVRFALSLLADKNGVIDVNLPISGSINDPQFSIWGLVWKVVGNLIVKAVSAPFSWMASGGTQQTAQVSFDPGSAALGASQLQALNQVAAGMKDRSQLQITLTPSANAASEASAIREARLRQGLIKLQQRRQVQGSAVAGDALPPRDSPAYLQLMRQLYREAPLKDKPRNLVGMLKDLPLAEMEQRLLGVMTVNDEQVRELALQRGLAVRDALLGLGLATQRIFLAAPRLVSSGADANATSALSVQLELALP
jgi:uncharacterized protein involved in outer membrane biogenesis